MIEKRLVGELAGALEIRIFLVEVMPGIADQLPLMVFTDEDLDPVARSAFARVAETRSDLSVRVAVALLDLGEQCRVRVDPSGN